MTGYETKAHAIIARYAQQAWRINKRKRGYRLPEVANALVRALGIHDATEREHEIKRLFEVEHLGAWTLV